MALCGVAAVGLSLASADASMYASAPAKAYAPAPAKYEEKKETYAPAPAMYAPSPAKYEVPAPAMKYEEKKEAYAAPAPAKYEVPAPAMKYEEKKEAYAAPAPAKYEEKKETYAPAPVMYTAPAPTPVKYEEKTEAYGTKKPYKRAVDDSMKEGAKKDVVDDPVELRKEIRHLQKALRTASTQADPSYYSRGYGYGYGYGYPYYNRRGSYYDEDEERAMPMSDDDLTDQHAKHSHMDDSDAIDNDAKMITADELREMMDALVINGPLRRPCPPCRCPPPRPCRPGFFCNRPPVALPLRRR